MSPITRAEIVDWETWQEERRPLERPGILAAKRLRRVSLGEHLTLLFENRDTVRYQIQEMMRAERIVRESSIRHEIATYNELLGAGGELGATLLVEIEDPAARGALLTAWRDVLPALYLLLPSGRRVAPTWDARQVGDDRLSSVQYLRFPVGGEAPVAFGCSFADPRLHGEIELSAETTAALGADLVG